MLDEATSRQSLADSITRRFSVKRREQDREKSPDRPGLVDALALVSRALSRPSCRAALIRRPRVDVHHIVNTGLS
ncbi:MAG: hypothetical protein EXQ91_01765 [Alphaproteobacteria bacterium]|nr:hypothetical protein [Alphaproteobacteria bacterium]